MISNGAIAIRPVNSVISSADGIRSETFPTSGPSFRFRRPLRPNIAPVLWDNRGGQDANDSSNGAKACRVRWHRTRIELAWNSIVPLIYLKRSREILLELRDPTKQMLCAAAKALSPSRGPIKGWISVQAKHRLRFQAMIEAALTEGASIAPPKNGISSVSPASSNDVGSPQ